MSVTTNLAIANPSVGTRPFGRFSFVADTGLVAALSLWLSAWPKQKP